MKDVRGHAEYFRFIPEHHGMGGCYMTPLMGEVEPGRIYLVTNPQTAGILADHPEWEPVNKRDHDAQTKADQKESDNEK